MKQKALGKKNMDALELSVKMTRMGGKILELIKLNKSFDKMKILDQFSYVFKRGEKIGIRGRTEWGRALF